MNFIYDGHQPLIPCFSKSNPDFVLIFFLFFSDLHLVFGRSFCRSWQPFISNSDLLFVFLGDSLLKSAIGFLQPRLNENGCQANLAIGRYSRHHYLRSFWSIISQLLQFCEICDQNILSISISISISLYTTYIKCIKGHLIQSLTFLHSPAQHLPAYLSCEPLKMKIIVNSFEYWSYTRQNIHSFVSMIYVI